MIIPATRSEAQWPPSLRTRKHAARNDHVRICPLRANQSRRLCVTAVVSRDDDHLFERGEGCNHISLSNGGPEESTLGMYWQRHGHEVSPNLWPPSRLPILIASKRTSSWPIASVLTNRDARYSTSKPLAIYHLVTIVVPGSRGCKMIGSRCSY